jgi:hypothetical protein
MPRKKQRQSRTPTHAYYHFQIIDWDWSYSFSANVPKYEDARFTDYRHLLVHGRLLRPRKIKVDIAELWFMPTVKPEDFEQKHDQPPPPGVGSLDLEGKKSEQLRLVGYLSMPADALQAVMQMLIADRFKFVLMNGEAMRYRHCFIRRYEFTAQHDEAEYPDDE